MIANRVKVHTLIYQSLLRFLDTLGIPIVATLRDSQNYIRAAESGLGIHEMKDNPGHEDTQRLGIAHRVACGHACAPAAQPPSRSNPRPSPR